MKSSISREEIERLKDDASAFSSFARDQSDSMIIHLLGRLGRLHNGNGRQPLIDLLRNPNETIRALSIKNLAKIADISLLPILVGQAGMDESSDVRREAVSAIGRLRDERAIPMLRRFLSDRDPKVVMQAIRGLLLFSDRPDIVECLQGMSAHPNELIQETIKREFVRRRAASDEGSGQSESPHFLRNLVVHGDVQEVLRYVPDESIHLTFTSPPYYNARDYSVYQSYEEYLRFLETVFGAVHRVTKEGRFFILNTSPIIIPRVSRAHSSKRYPIPYDIHPRLVRQGWEFIDDIVWVKPEASVKNRNAGFRQHRKPLAYKPNPVSEMLMVYRKKSDRLIDWNIRQYDHETVVRSRVASDYETTNIWRIDPVFDRVHSAVFPLELCNRVIQFYSYMGDLIFDPFGGSGTLGRAALNLQRHFFLAEQEIKYVRRMQEEFLKSTSMFHSEESQSTFVGLQEFRERAGRSEKRHQ